MSETEPNVVTSVSGTSKVSSRKAPRVSGTSEGPDGTREYVVRSTKLLAPGETGPIPYRLRRAARVVDVDVGGDAELVKAALGPRRILLEEDGESEGERKVLSDVLAAEPYDGSAGAFVVLTVRNTGSEPRHVEARIRVSAERGPEVEGPSPFRMNADGSVKGAGRPLRNGTRPSPFSPSPRVVMPPEITSRRPGGGLRRPPPGGERARALRERVAKPPKVVTVPAVVQPKEDGEHVVVFFRVHVEALVRLFAIRSPIRRPQRAALVRELQVALEREGSDATAEIGKVGVSLQRRDLDRLLEALRLHREQLMEDEGGRLALAFKRALEPGTPPATADAPESEKRPALTLIESASGQAPKDVSTSSSPVDERIESEDEVTEEITEE